MIENSPCLGECRNLYGTWSGLCRQVYASSTTKC